MKPARKLKRKIIRFLFREQWSIIICDREGTVLKEISPPPDKIWADPFPVYHEGKYYLFLEEQPIDGKGILGCIEIHNDLSPGSFIPVLDLPHHLSWPNVFSVKENDLVKWYLVPESNAARTIECYRATKFPYEWEHDTTLLSGIRAADPELYFDGNTWFLFASISDGRYGMNDSLFVYSSNQFPSKEWKPLSENPVTTGRTNSRMAGKIYRNGTGSLVRPAQYSKSDYGQRVVLNSIEYLTTDNYREKEISVVVPEKKLKAVCTHTWNPCGDYIFRDIKKRFFKPLWRFKKHKGTHS